jgi:hypothetical protein
MIDQAIKIACESPKSAFREGCQATYIRVDDQWGMKFFENSAIRDKTYRLQQLAHGEKAAPALGEKFEFRLEGQTKFGYITESVTATWYDRWAEANHEVDPFATLGDYGCLYDEIRQFMEDSLEHTNLIFRLEKCGLRTRDMHWKNVGWLPNGDFVAIDFDLCEEQEESEELPW